MPLLHRRALLALSTLLIGGPALAARKPPPVTEVQGLVTQVIDAATVRFTPTGGSAITVRLRDIDPPEPCQPWGAEARAALSALVLNKPATLRAGPLVKQERMAKSLGRGLHATAGAVMPREWRRRGPCPAAN